MKVDDIRRLAAQDYPPDAVWMTVDEARELIEDCGQPQTPMKPGLFGTALGVSVGVMEVIL